MPTAYNLVPTRFGDGRHSAIEAGLAACGYEVRRGYEGQALAPGDLLCTWNLHVGNSWPISERFRQAGCRVLVFEESPLRRLLARKIFSISIDAHNSVAGIPNGGPQRWGDFALPLAPWRSDGTHVLVCPSRGMGAPAARQPAGWPRDVCERLARLTKRPIRLRAHPGKGYAARPLEVDLEDAWAVVVWASGAAVQALIGGVPVFYEGPHLFVAGAAGRGIANIERPAGDADRLAALRHMAWGQWFMEEIVAGLPFKHLLEREYVASSRVA